MNTLTAAEVKALHDEQVSLWGKSDGFNARQAARTRVHEALQAKNPPPFSSLAPDMVEARNRRTPLTHAEKAFQHAHQIAQLGDEHHEAYGRARAAGDKDAIGCADAHHYHQKLHGKALWVEAERLVTELLGGAS